MEIFDKISQERGMVSKIYSEFKDFPQSVVAHFEMNKALILSDGPLPREEREYLAFKTSEANKNIYCSTHHKTAYENFKTTGPKKILEELAVTLTKEPNQTSWLKDRFIAQGYNEAQWQHAVNIIAYFNYTNRLAFGMNIKIEENFEKSCT